MKEIHLSSNDTQINGSSADQESSDIKHSVSYRRGFFGKVLGAGAGAAAVITYGRNTQAAQTEGAEVTEEDIPDEESEVLAASADPDSFEASGEKLKLAEAMAHLIESGAVTSEYVAGTRESLAGAGVVAMASTEKGKKPVQSGRRKFLGTVGALLGGAIIASKADWVQAEQKIGFVTNCNSNRRYMGSAYTADEVREMRRREVGGYNISLDQFTRLPECESPRGARLFVQNEAIVEFNGDLRERKKHGQDLDVEFMQRPIVTMPGWYKKENVHDPHVVLTLFRTAEEVPIRGDNGQVQMVYKYYGVAQVIHSDTRDPHKLGWSGYLGTDRDRATQAMEFLLNRR